MTTTYYELNYTNMDGRPDTRTFYNEEEALRWARLCKKSEDKELKLLKIEATEMDF